MALPVSNVAGVKLELVVISQQPLLDVTQVHGLPVDEDEPHAALEAASRVLAVRSGAAWTERTEGLHAAKLTSLRTIGLLTGTCPSLLRQVVVVVFSARHLCPWLACCVIDEAINMLARGKLSKLCLRVFYLDFCFVCHWLLQLLPGLVWF